MKRQKYDKIHFKELENNEKTTLGYTVSFE